MAFPFRITWSQLNNSRMPKRVARRLRELKKSYAICADTTLNILHCLFCHGQRSQISQVAEDWAMSPTCLCTGSRRAVHLLYLLLHVRDRVAPGSVHPQSPGRRFPAPFPQQDPQTNREASRGLDSMGAAMCLKYPGPRLVDPSQVGQPERVLPPELNCDFTLSPRSPFRAHTHTHTHVVWATEE